MLSKKQARAFFLGGTLVTFLIFIGLTVYSLSDGNDQTNKENITESVIRGKKIWETNNCMGCHTILGEGAYYAPELTQVYNRRSEEFIKLFIKDPVAMYPGKRKMVKYNFSDGEIGDLISFFKWISEIDANGFPAEPFLKKYTSSGIIRTGVISNIKKPEIFGKLCLSCHTLDGNGQRIEPAPSLDNIGNIRDRDYLEKWIKDPNMVKKGALMPKFPLSDETISELADFLSKQKIE